MLKYCAYKMAKQRLGDSVYGEMAKSSSKLYHRSMAISEMLVRGIRGGEEAESQGY